MKIRCFRTGFANYYYLCEIAPRCFLRNVLKIMVIQFIILAAGLALILLGANWLVDGSSSVARKSGLSEFLIGLTIVGIGTSAPEMVVSFISAFQNRADMAIGNVVGSNIFNTMMILGVTAMITPLVITRRNLRSDIPVNIAVTGLLIFLGMKKSIFGIGRNEIGRLEGILLLLIFAWYLWSSFRNDSQNMTESEKESEAGSISVHKSVFMAAAGIAALVGGGKLFVGSAARIAEYLHLSEKFIAITIMSAGTSLPELATCIIAAVKGRGQLALGNILGSNISNILLVLGGSAVISPLSFSGMTPVDLGAVMICAIFIFASAHTFETMKLDRFEGGMLLAMEAAYMTWLFTNPF